MNIEKITVSKEWENEFSTSKFKLNGFDKLLNMVMKLDPQSNSIDSSFFPEVADTKNLTFVELWELMKKLHYLYYSFVTEGRDVHEIAYFSYEIKQNLIREQHKILHFTKTVKPSHTTEYFKSRTFTPEKQSILRQCFETESRPTKDEISLMANKLHLSEVQIRNWVSYPLGYT